MPSSTTSSNPKASIPSQSDTEKAILTPAEKPPARDAADPALALPQPPPRRDLDRYQQMNKALWFFFIASVVSSPFLFGFDLIVVGSVQPRVIAQLNQENKLPWISVSYALAGASTTLLWGRLYGLFNIKWIFIASLVIFEAGAAVSGSARDMNTLIGGRVLSGVGAIGAYAGAMTTLAVVTTIQQRPLYISFITIAYGLSTILAPIIGGAFADSIATWRWAFYINICIGALFTPGYLLLLPSKCFIPAQVTTWQRLQRLDLVSNVLWAGASVSLIMGVSCGGAIWAWTSRQSIALFASTGVLWLLFVLQQAFPLGTSNEYRLFPVRLLHSLEMANLFLQTTASSSAALIPVFLIPIYFAFVRGSSALTASLYLLPLVILRSVFILVNGVFMRKLGYVMPWFVAGAALCLAGSVPFLTATLYTPPAHIAGWTALIGAGVGMYNQAGFAAAQARTTPALAPQAIAFITTAQVGGSAAALAVTNAIFLNRASRLIAAVLPRTQAQAVGFALLSGAQGSTLDGLSTAQRIEVITDIVHALDAAWIPVVVASGFSLVLAPFLKRDKLFQ